MCWVNWQAVPFLYQEGLCLSDALYYLALVPPAYLRVFRSGWVATVWQFACIGRNRRMPLWQRRWLPHFEHGTGARRRIIRMLWEFKFNSRRMLFPWWWVWLIEMIITTSVTGTEPHHLPYACPLDFLPDPGGLCCYPLTFILRLSAAFGDLRSNWYYSSVWMLKT